MDHQQYIQLARPLGALSANATSTTMQPNDAARFIDMCPPLYLAVHQGRTEEVMALLLQQHGAAIDCQPTGIIQHGQCDILEVSAERNTVLHVAAEQGHDVLIRELYAKFTEKVKGLLSRQNSARDTPLHCAARAGRVGAVDELVRLARDCGESILECKNEAGDTALHLAARHGHGTVLDSLVSAAAEPAAELNNAGVSPLYLAVMSGSVQAVRAITTCRDASSIGPSSQNALHAAVFKSSEMVHLLLEWRPTLADQVDCSGSNPLHFASSDGHSSIVGAILHAAQPRTVYAKDSGGLSALHVAARMGHDRVVKKLLESCPDAAEVRDDHGGTFLHAAAKENRSKVVSLAIKNPMLRGLLDAHDRDGNTPLHLAVAPGASTVVVDALLRKGKVRADVLNNDGKTPLDLAAESTSLVTMVTLVMTLVSFGAQPRPQRQDHLNPWHGHDIVQGIEKTFDSLAVVAVLIATVVFQAGFNLPGGYDGNGKANLGGGAAFKSFLFLNTRRGNVRGRGDPACLREGVALRRLVEELRGVAVLHVGVADQPDAGLLRGFECRVEYKSSLEVHGYILVLHCLDVLHRDVDRACNDAAHNLEVSVAVQALEWKTCHQEAVSARRRFHTLPVSVYGYKRYSYYRFYAYL